MAIYLNGQLVAGAAMVNVDGEQLATKDDLKGLDQLNTSSSDENKALIIDGNGKITLSDNTIDNMGGESGTGDVNLDNYVIKVKPTQYGNIAVLDSDGSLGDSEIHIDNIARREGAFVNSGTIIISDDSGGIKESGKTIEDIQGQDGVTPHIGENNHWYIGTEDTGVVAKGEDGQSPVVTATKSNKVTTIRVNGTEIARINDGATGSQGPVGPAGESITITNTTESQEDGGSNIITFSNGTNITIKNGKTGPQGPVGATGDPGISMAQFKALNLVNRKVINEECYLSWDERIESISNYSGKLSKEKFTSKDASKTKYTVTKMTADIYYDNGGGEVLLGPRDFEPNNHSFYDCLPGNALVNENIILIHERDAHCFQFTAQNTTGHISIPYDLTEVSGPVFNNIKLYIDPIDFGDFVIYEEVNS